MTRVLLVEDNRGDARLFAELLAEVPSRPFVLTAVDTLAAAVAAVAGQDIVFLDLSLPDAHGLATLTAMVGATRATPIVVLTGHDDDRVAVEAVKLGAQDYLRKAEITPSLIARTAWYAIERKKAEEHAVRLAHLDEAARRARLISGATAAITASLDLDVTLREVVKLLVPQLGDLAIVDLLREDGTFDRVAHAGASPEICQQAEFLYEHPPGPTNPRSPVLRAAETRASVMLEELDITPLVPDEHERYQVFARTFGVSSLLVTPLIARERVVGTITYAMGPSGRRYSDDLRLLAEEVAERIALGIENAKLYAAAQQAVRARDELLAVVSHDLRNPLGVVALTLEMMNAEATPNSPLPRATRAVERMQRLIEDLLDVSRIEAGTLAVTLESIELGSILDDSFEQHRPHATDKRIELVRDYVGPVGLIEGDRHRLGQTLANLLGNALKFTPAGGTVRLGAERRNDEIVITVSDSGSGIAPEHLPHIFDRFWQPERRRDGVGLGLAIVKGIVDAHEGSLAVESTPGAGATFRVGLRISPVEAPSGARAAAVPALR